MFHSCPVSAVACHPDNTLVATGGAEGNVKIVNTKTGAVITSFEDHTDNIESLAFSASAPVLLASASLDGTVRVFDVTRHTTLHTCKHDVSLDTRGGTDKSAALCHRPHVVTFTPPVSGCRRFCEMAPHSPGALLVLPGRNHSGVGRAQRRAPLHVCRAPKSCSGLSNHQVSLTLGDGLAAPGNACGMAVKRISQVLPPHAVLPIRLRSSNGRRVVSSSEDSTVMVFDVENLPVI